MKASRSTKPSRKLTQRPPSSQGEETDRDRRTSLRKTGIRFCSEMPWGAHVCLFYETREDLLETNASYVKAGLHNNEYCIWAISEMITEEQAWAALRREISDLDNRVLASQLEILRGYDWYLGGGQFSSRKISRGWHEKLRYAQDQGFDGVRISGNAFWLESSEWTEFREYEKELNEALAGRHMLMLCTYALDASRSVDLLDVARAHHFTIARRNGEWEFLETPELRQAKQEIKNLGEALSVLSRPFKGRDALTARERIVLAQIVRGASNKEAARWLNVSYRTVEFHRANIMQKFGAKNTADLVRKVTASVNRAKRRA